MSNVTTKSDFKKIMERVSALRTNLKVSTSVQVGPVSGYSIEGRRLVVQATSYEALDSISTELLKGLSEIYHRQMGMFPDFYVKGDKGSRDAKRAGVHTAQFVASLKASA